MIDRVWIVSKGCRYEGGEVHSVHATHESALWFERMADWDMERKADNCWLNSTDFIEIKEWTVTKVTP